VRRQGEFRRGPSVPADRAPLASASAEAHTADSGDEAADSPDADEVSKD
jgi:hypothetical protein